MSSFKKIGWLMVFALIMAACAQNSTTKVTKPQPDPTIWTAEGQEVDPHDWVTFVNYLIDVDQCCYNKARFTLRDRYLVGDNFSGKLNMNDLIKNCKKPPENPEDGSICGFWIQTIGVSPPDAQLPAIVMQYDEAKLPCRMLYKGKYYYFKEKDWHKYYKHKNAQQFTEQLASGKCIPYSELKRPPKFPHIYFDSPVPVDPDDDETIFVLSKASVLTQR